VLWKRTFVFSVFCTKLIRYSKFVQFHVNSAHLFVILIFPTLVVQQRLVQCCGAGAGPERDVTPVALHLMLNVCLLFKLSLTVQVSYLSHTY
jgi:hypothetical protein